ncbi:MAG: hypothetical protein CSA38_00935 [Flavobacteriales bacterium]|nr:MAG: hypothetical protein CSA38_00935 [Flavobacteriales bacterium]
MTSTLSKRIKLLILLTIIFSCKKDKVFTPQKYTIQSCDVNGNVKKSIYEVKKMMSLRGDYRNEHNFTVIFHKKRDTVFMEIGVYKPKFDMRYIRGVYIEDNDTIYLAHKNIKNTSLYFKPSKNKIIVKEEKFKFEYFDPFSECFFLDKKNNFQFKNYGQCSCIDW